MFIFVFIPDFCQEWPIGGHQIIGRIGFISYLLQILLESQLGVLMNIICQGCRNLSLEISGIWKRQRSYKVAIIQWLNFKIDKIVDFTVRLP